VPGPRQEPQFTTRSKSHTAPEARSAGAAPEMPEPSTPWSRSDRSRDDAPDTGRGIWQSGAIWLAATGIAIGISAVYLIYATIVAPITPPSPTAPSAAAPWTSSPAPPVGRPAPAESAPVAPDPVAVSRVPPVPAPKPAGPSADPPPPASPVVETPAPARQPANQPERIRQTAPHPAPKHAPADPPRFAGWRDSTGAGK
jgi:hypothetical protein